MDSRSLEFNSFDEFLSWKEKEERNSQSWYVQQCAPQESHGKQHWYYYCNRAGNYNQQGKGQRCMKSQGTCKIVSHCSAHIKANMETNNIIVYYNSTHYKHKAQLGHLKIPNTTRKLIASKLRSGVTTQRIIDDIRDTTQSRQLNREHVVCRKDITNIQKQYTCNIEGIRRHQNDLISVSSIAEEMDTLPYNPVIVFKQQGELPTDFCRHLKKDNFLLVIQTDFQRDMLSSHGNKGVCMAATYRINDNGFNLITLMVLDSYEEGIPVAWALSSREDKPVLLTVLYSLNKRCGGVAPCWFMSDLAQQYYSAWEEVFGGDNTKYLCALGTKPVL